MLDEAALPHRTSLIEERERETEGRGGNGVTETKVVDKSIRFRFHIAKYKVETLKWFSLIKMKDNPGTLE